MNSGTSDPTLTLRGDPGGLHVNGVGLEFGVWSEVW